MTFSKKDKIRIFTVGHSTLDFDSFLDVLNSYNIEKLIDVRSYPGSRYVPHFNKENLLAELTKNNIEYAHFLSLGGRRKSRNNEDYGLVSGWKNTSFQNYASYTMTNEYEQGIKELIKEAKKRNICIMCAESVPWRCHRLLISNTLILNEIEVLHIMNKTEYKIHRLNLYGAHAEINGDKIIYPNS